MKSEGLKFNLGISKTGDVVIDTLVNHGVKDVGAYWRGITTMPMMNPANLFNIDKAYKRLTQAIATSEKIGILVDSDADGMTSASLLYKAILELGADVEMFFLPEKSHGLKDAMNIINNNSYTLVMTPDSSSNNIDEHKELQAKGVDVIVLDHHIVEIDIEDTPAIIVNNQLPQNKDANKNYVGVGMVFLFLQYMHDLDGTFNMDSFLPWLAFGQITDISDISDPELHPIVRKGLTKMNEHPLFNVMLEGAEATPHSIGFDVAPKVNAVARIGGYEERANLLEALTANMSVFDKEIVQQKRKDKSTGKFRTIEVFLNKYEVEYEQLKKIKSLQDRITKKALDKITILSKEEDGLILALLDEETPRSVTGLIANKLSSKNQKPALVVAESEMYYSGSMRSYGDFEMRTWLNDTGVATASGHERASGVEFLMSDYGELLQKADGLDVSQDHYDVDAIYNEYTINNRPLTQINDSIGLFGGQVKEPLLGFKGVPIDKRYIKVSGSTLMFSINNVSFVMFNGIDAYEGLKQGFTNTVYCDIVGVVNRNTWGGKVTNQVIISDIALSGKEDSGIEMPDELVF